MKDTNDIWDEIEMSGHGESLDEEMFEFISAYADGECSAKERRLVEAYLAENTEARALLADLRAQGALTTSDIVEPPEWLRDSILAKTTRRRFLGGRLPLVGRLAAAAGAAAIAVFIVMPKANLDQPLVVNFVGSDPLIDMAAPEGNDSFSDSLAEEPLAIRTESDVQLERRVLSRASQTRPAIDNSGFVAGIDAPPPPPVAGPPTPVNGNRVEPRQESEPQPMAFTGPGYSTSRGEPGPVDTVALTGGRDDTAERTPPPPVRTRRSEEVLPAARERLREGLERVNAQQDDIKEVINSK